MVIVEDVVYFNTVNIVDFGREMVGWNIIYNASNASEIERSPLISLISPSLAF